MKIIKSQFPHSPTSNCLVAEMEKLEQTIAKAQAIIAAASAKKQAIMQAYL
jgi:hypothetical protein